MRVSTLFVSAFALVGLAVSPAAKAGEYYSSGYHRSGYSNGYYGNGYNGGNVSYSSSCCYQKVVRHYSTTRYVRVNANSYNGNGYYRPAYRSAYHVSRPRRYAYDNYYAPPRYDSYAPRRYVSYSGDSGYGYNGYARASYGPDCYTRRMRANDGYGGWVWVTRRVCN